MSSNSSISETNKRILLVEDDVRLSNLTQDNLSL
ncbi:hypothetical protein MNBD_GAMMA16-525 [hydrothermal vent metagenome]|uniref:Uncharacterized protein n=1 Tax=hydrothermal vent metagenome TaxID=652676 RepID=A0A3B0YUI4_9ZZZZ